MSAKFDEFPSLPFQDIKDKPKRHWQTERRTDGQCENSIPPTNIVCGGYNKHSGGVSCSSCNAFISFGRVLWPFNIISFGTKLIKLLGWGRRSMSFVKQAEYGYFTGIFPSVGSPWTQWTLSMDPRSNTPMSTQPIDNVHSVHGQYRRTMSTQSMDNVHWDHGQGPLSPWTFALGISLHFI